MSQAVRILHLEDSAADCELIPATLEAGGFQVHSRPVASRAEYIAALDEGGFDLILADCKLPSFDGLEALALARERRPETPFLFVSGFIGEEAALESLKHGATDYVFKHNLARLAPAVRRALQEACEQKQKKQLEEQFLRAQRLESVGTLASGIAHDLNNVLAPLVMSLRLFRGKLKDPEDVEILDSLEASARRGADIIRQVLAFARGTPGARELVCLGRLVEDLGRMIRETFPRSIRLDLCVAPGLQKVTGDATQLYQVLMNLCVNARDAMAEGGRLSVSLDNVTLETAAPGAPLGLGPGPYVVVTVTDTGPGIAPADLGRIFDPFFTTKPTGTGLGLSTALTLVKGHGGFITVASEPGQGAAFKVFLPAPPVAGLAAGAEEPVEIPRGHGERILLVDDEAAVRRVSQATLMGHGYQVRTAADGAEALRLMEEEADRIALVVTDMMMPVLGGGKLLQVLRERYPAVPVIAMSGLPEHQAWAGPSRSGGAAFLPKPFPAERLLQAVHAALLELS